ncbi:MAG TPA: serine/threonine-protein kinase, partial [Planctomycetota bacterium]|nr:serine/threonine-protein kinase [Planctomycetota bacterium]
MTELDGSRSLEEAEKVYFSYRRRVDEGEPVDFDAFCEAHATIADDLRFLHSALSGGSTIDLGASLSKVAAEILGDRSIEGMLASLAPFRARPGEVSENDGLGVDPGDRYRILGEVGRGGMSRILRVEDRELGRTVAMKIAYDARAPRGQGRAATASGSSLERLVAEAYVTARLEHPGIIPVYDCGLSRNGAAYYTMRLVKGRDFRVAIELARASSKDFSFERALEVLARVCEAVAFAHAKGVIHRDLKPNNIMVGAFGEAYVLDWGLAKIIGAKDRHAARMRFGGDVSLTTVATRASGRESDDPEDPLVTPAGTILGTPVFMPPEQAKGDVERINPSSDVYALGAILYTLLAGRPPYVPENGRASPLAILGEIAERPPQPIGEIDPSAPKALIAVAEKAMARRQEDRFESALELKEAIEAAGSAGKLRPRAALAATGGAAPRPGSRTLLASGALLLAGFLAIASLVLLSRRSDPDALDSRALVSLQTLRDLETDALELVPASTESLPRLENWLARARVWIERTGELRVESARAGGEATRDNVASTSVSRALAALEAFSAPDGYLARVEERLVFAREVRRRTIDEAWELWQKAIASISDRERSPSYDGLTISPQEGLLPLGPDPHSGLWEFGHLATGRVP